MVHLERPTLEQGLDGGNNKLARALGSVDNPTREKGLEALARWLSRQGGASEEDVLKIWKGVFYCFWHADKASFQVQYSRTDTESIADGCLGMRRTLDGRHSRVSQAVSGSTFWASWVVLANPAQRFFSTEPA